MAGVVTADHSTDLGEAETFPRGDTSSIPLTPMSVYAIAVDKEGSRGMATVRRA